MGGTVRPSKYAHSRCPDSSTTDCGNIENFLFHRSELCEVTCVVPLPPLILPYLLRSLPCFVRGLPGEGVNFIREVIGTYEGGIGSLCWRTRTRGRVLESEVLLANRYLLCRSLATLRSCLVVKAREIETQRPDLVSGSWRPQPGEPT